MKKVPTSLWVSLIALAVFVVVAALVFAGLTADVDLALMLAAPELHGKVGNALAIMVSQGMGFVGLSVATALLAAGLMFRRRLGDAVMVATTMLAGLGVMYLLKLFFERARPEIFPWIDPANGFSFPSGHAFLNATFWLLLAAIVRRRWAWVLGAGVALFVGVFRVICGVHWPSDVVGGWTLGVSLVALAVAVRSIVEARKPSPTPSAPTDAT